MSRIAPRIIVVCIASMVAACAPLSTLKPIVEKTRLSSLPNQDLFSATLRYAQEQNWEIVSSDAGLGSIEALTAVEDADGMKTRERWIVSTRDGEIGIELRFEVYASSMWQSSDVVCEGYSYFRENMHLSGITDQARSSLVSVGPASTSQPQHNQESGSVSGINIANGSRLQGQGTLP